MNFNAPKYIVFLYCLVSLPILFAQEGGPPMLTDDARVADFKEWELNTSILTIITDHVQLGIPHIDLNYGVFHNLQLKIEMPLTLDFFPEKKTEIGIGEIIGGIKYRFLDEEKHYVSAATFPQYTINHTRGFLLPIFVEKTFGKFLSGIAIGYFLGLKRENHSELGGLIGYKPTPTTDLMLEYYSIQSYYDVKGNNGYLNFGFRQELSEHFMLMGSFGTQLVLPSGGMRERFIAYIGFKSLF